jgi:hypothetical protein
MTMRIPTTREQAVKTTLARWALKVLQAQRLNHQSTQGAETEREPISRPDC